MIHKQESQTNREENKENFFGNDRPDEEAVEVSPPRAQNNDIRAEPQEVIDEPPPQPVVVSNKIEEPAVEIKPVEASEPTTVKPAFPNLEPNFDFNFLEDQPEEKPQTHQREDINDLFQDINDI